MRYPMNGQSVGRKEMVTRGVRMRHRGQRVSSTSKEHVRSAVEGFALARNTGSIKATLTQVGDMIVLELYDTKVAQVCTEEQASAEEYGPTAGAVRLAPQEIDSSQKEVDQQFLEESARSNEELAMILSQGDMLSLTALLGMSQWSRDQVKELQEGGGLLALRGVSARFKYPEWQFVRRAGKIRVLEGLDRVIDALGGDMWATYHFLMSDLPNSRKRAWKGLLDGNVEGVLGAIPYEEV